jgi:hypothetical protein
MSIRPLRVMLPALLLVLSACGTRAAGGDALQQMNRVPLVVQNQNFYPATVFAIVNSSRLRLGEVSGNSTSTFEAPSPPTGQIRIEVRLLAVGAFTSYPITFASGDTVHVTVPPDLHRRAGRRR